jgi:hypothetical protein
MVQHAALMRFGGFWSEGNYCISFSQFRKTFLASRTLTQG